MHSLEEWHRKPTISNNGRLDLYFDVYDDQVESVERLIYSYRMSTKINLIIEDSDRDYRYEITTKSVLFLGELWHIINNKPLTIEYEHLK